MGILKLEIELIIFILIIIFLITFYYLKDNKKRGRINEWSYQRYARFYGNTVLKDEEFDKKLNTIYNLIVNKGKTDLKEIARLSSCTFEECILKIKYLKNKRKIGDLYIDSINGTISKCSKEDKKLLDKYKKYIYYNHYQLDEIVTNLPNASLDNLEYLKEQTLNELLYLDNKGLLNGVIINPVDEKIIYYTIEKHKKEKDFVTINCPNCGAINDVNRNGKSRCEYCKGIVEDNKK